MNNQIKFQIFVNGELLDVKSFANADCSFTIGSGPTDISVAAEGVSEQHAFFSYSGGIALLGAIDHGISVNGADIGDNAVLQSGDSISIGELTIILELPSAEEVTDPVVQAPMSLSKPSSMTLDKPALQIVQEDDDEDYISEDSLQKLIAEKRSKKFNTPVSILEVHQLLGHDIVDVKHFASSANEISIGTEVKHRFRFIGRPVAWVPGFFASFSWLMYPFTEANQEWKSDFYAPVDQTLTLFSWKNNVATCRIQKNWKVSAFTESGTLSMADLQSAGTLSDAGSHFECVVPQTGGLIIEIGNTSFLACMVPKGQAIVGGILADVDYPFGALLTVLTLLSSALTYFILYNVPVPEIDKSKQEELLAELIELDMPPPPEEKKDDANKDAGEGAKAKKEEGKVGKKDAIMKEAKGPKVESDKRQKDKEVVDQFMSGLNFGAASDSGATDGFGGIASLDASMEGGLGGVMGARGVQAGSGGLGGSGGGLGGGGTADGIGGLGTKGTGLGSSGYGKGGGSVGEKREGGSIKSGGTPIILGALDKSLIDAVIKRNMSQIRYCYQRELTKNPNLKGKIVVKFTIAADGSVSKASIDSSSMGSNPVESCITGRFLRFKFPEPKGGGVVIVKYPFIFSA